MAHKIIIAGGTGFLGHSLVEYFKQQEEGVEIVILTRGKANRLNDISFVHWDANNMGDWVQQLEGSTAIINLVGKSVNCRYTAANKEAIVSSRVNATMVIAKAIREAIAPPGVWINAASTAIFGDAGDSLKDEFSTTGEGFSPFVCKQWEQAFFSIETPQTRKVLLRMGLVFQKGKGLLVPFANLVKIGLGGNIGTGNQYISWVHENDFVKIVHASLVDPGFEGVFHCASPHPVTNRLFMTALRKALKKPFGFTNPALLVKAGALLIGTEAELVLTGRRVVSKKLEQKNFQFQYPQIQHALADLLATS